MSVTAAVRDKFRAEVGQTKVKRYWPGKAPEGANDNVEDGDILMSRVSALDKAEERKDDPRLHRLANIRIDNRQDVRKIRQAEIVSSSTEDNTISMDENENDEDALRDEERMRIREKNLLNLSLEEEEEKEEEGEEEEEEEESESDEEEQGGIAMVKPEFNHKQSWFTIAERERLEEKERSLKENLKRKDELRAETKERLVEIIREDEEIHLNMKKVDDHEVDTDIDEKKEYESWESREFARIKRKRTEVKEKEKIEKVRQKSAKKKRRCFMQKHYHKGAFFQDDSTGIYDRDFSDPTGEDKMDKAKLPKVMQVKHFGRSGRTKWTHLRNEDTTDRSCNRMEANWCLLRGSQGQKSI